MLDDFINEAQCEEYYSDEWFEGDTYDDDWGDETGDLSYDDE